MAEVQKLAEVIRAKGIVLGETEVGKEFAMKCLHPSDPAVTCQGVPDGGCMPTFMHNYQYVTTIEPAPTGTTTWETDIVLLPHPRHIGYAKTTTLGVSGTSYVTFVNTQCPTDTDFPKQISRYRLAYWSVTGFFDAPALANQGTIIATQYPLGRTKVDCGYAADNPSQPRVSIQNQADKMRCSAPDAAPSASSKCDRTEWRNSQGVVTDEPVSEGFTATKQAYSIAVFGPPTEAFIEDLKPFSVLQTMPNAYMGLAKDGFYVPGRVQKFKWRLAREQRYFMSYANAINTLLDSNDDLIGFGQYTRVSDPANTPLGVQSPPGSTDFGTKTPGLTCVPCSNDILHISARNCAVGGRFTLYIRYGFEYQAQPGSVFSPLLKAPVPADHQAIRVVHAISRELKDAYPSSYNDFGKLLGVIANAATGLAPMLGSFAPLAMGIGTGARLLSSVIPSKGAGKTNPRDKPAAAAVERVHQRMQEHSAPVVVAPSRSPPRVVIEKRPRRSRSVGGRPFGRPIKQDPRAQAAQDMLRALVKNSRRRK